MGYSTSSVLYSNNKKACFPNTFLTCVKRSPRYHYTCVICGQHTTTYTESHTHCNSACTLTSIGRGNFNSDFLRIFSINYNRCILFVDCFCLFKNKRHFIHLHSLFGISSSLVMSIDFHSEKKRFNMLSEQ